MQLTGLEFQTYWRLVANFIMLPWHGTAMDNNWLEKETTTIGWKRIQSAMSTLQSYKRAFNSEATISSRVKTIDSLVLSCRLKIENTRQGILLLAGVKLVKLVASHIKPYATLYEQPT